MSGIMERVESETRQEVQQVAGEEGPLLAAALAAALVEYRRYVGRIDSHIDTDNDQTNWRLAGRLEQLRSPA